MYKQIVALRKKYMKLAEEERNVLRKMTGSVHGYGNGYTEGRLWALETVVLDLQALQDEDTDKRGVDVKHVMQLLRSPGMAGYLLLLLTALVSVSMLHELLGLLL